MARVGGLVLLVMGLAIAGMGVLMAQALLGHPLPAGEVVERIRPFLARIAEQSALPTGSDVGALVTRGWGQVAVAALAAGAVIGLGGLRQVLTGRRSIALLVVIAAIIVGFAVAAAVA